MPEMRKAERMQAIPRMVPGVQEMVAPRVAQNLGPLDVLHLTATPSPAVPDMPGDTAPAGADEPNGVVGDAGATLGDSDSAGNTGAARSLLGAETVEAAFLRGYRDADGLPAWEPRVLAMVQCESEWRLDPPGFHLGLAQFALGTWGQARCSPEANYRDPWEQGCAVARWMAIIAPHYGTSLGWPSCWSP